MQHIHNAARGPAGTRLLHCQASIHHHHHHHHQRRNVADTGSKDGGRYNVFYERMIIILKEIETRIKIG